MTLQAKQNQLPMTFDRQEFTQELLGNILPFWINHTPDPMYGGFYGALTNDLRILNETLRSSVLCSRILWTFSAAYRQFKDPKYLNMAEYAYQTLISVFWDKDFSGVYWLVDKTGQPVADRKQSYAQAFAIYGLAEYARITNKPESLEKAKDLFTQLETHAHDPRYGGYFEGCSREWQVLEDSRLSEKEPYCRKSMNTLLHVLEAYTNLFQVWPDPKVKNRLDELLNQFYQHVIATEPDRPERAYFKLFFDDDFRSFPGPRSYGHDIEGSWLLVEAAEALQDPDLLAIAKKVAIRMAQTAYDEGRDIDGSLFYEGSGQSIENPEKHWWVQAEGLVGFYNAYQLSGEPHFGKAARDCWRFIQDHLVDRVNGDWFKVTDRHGVPFLDHVKTGPWECPYHHSRACLELLRRLT